MLHEVEEKSSTFLSLSKKVASDKYETITEVTKRNLTEYRVNQLKHCVKDREHSIN
jgi:hypothetical protein